jgi:hypothetical protein
LQQRKNYRHQQFTRQTRIVDNDQKKTTAREHRNTFEEVNNKFLPINLPLFELEVYDKSDTKYIITIPVDIRTKRGNPQSIKYSRLLVAILAAL